MSSTAVIATPRVRRHLAATTGGTKTHPVQPAVPAHPQGFVLQVDLTEVDPDDLVDLLRTVQNLADLAAEWFPQARTRAAVTGPDGPLRAVPATAADTYRARLRAVPSAPVLVLDARARTLTVGGRTVDLTTTESALLLHLASATPRVVRREQLLESVWGGRGLPVDSRTVICVLTHDPKFDVPALVTAVGTKAAYIGAMGSRRTHEDRVVRLKEAGLTDDEVARIHSPIGLDLGARTPEETAISIAAEIVQARWGGSGANLRASDGPIHAGAPR